MEYDQLIRDKWDLMISKAEEAIDAVSMLTLKEEFGEEILYNQEFAYYLLIKILKDWIDVDEECYSIIANWILGTYFIDSFVSYPYLFINAVKRSGKTRLLKLLAKLSFNGIYTSDMTEAVLFRLPSIRQCTFAIDEAENITGKEKTALRLLLNSAYKKGMKIYRARKIPKSEKYTIDEFEIFMPIALANITGIGDVLEDRCITIILERSNNVKITSKLEYFELDCKFQVFRDVMTQISAGSAGSAGVLVEKKYIAWTRLLTTLYTNYTNYTTNTTNTTNTPSLPEQIIQANIVGRDLECWYPLLIINTIFNPNNFAEFLSISAKFVSDKRTMDVMEDRDTSILIFLGNFITQKSSDDFFSYNEIRKEFMESEQVDWLSSWLLSGILKRLKVIVERRRMNRGVEVRLNFLKIKAKLKDLGVETQITEVKQEKLSENEKDKL